MAMVEAAREALPFQLTCAQDRTLHQVLADMAKPFPMNRLLQVWSCVFATRCLLFQCLCRSASPESHR